MAKRKQRMLFPDMEPSDDLDKNPDHPEANNVPKNGEKSSVDAEPDSSPPWEEEPLRPNEEPEKIVKNVQPEEIEETGEATTPEILKSDSSKTSDQIDLEDRTVWVLDSHSMIYQLLHALPEMSSPAGEPVRVVFGFARDVLQILEKHRPDYLFAAFDMPGPTFRHELYTDYKATRPPMPDELPSQIARIREMLALMGVPTLGVPSFEADDILATMAGRVEQRNGRCVLVTTDKDCRQLLSDRTTMFNLRKQAVYNAESLKEDWGIRPDQVVDFQSLVGDSSDNVPGVSLFGPKLTRQLLESYETLEGIFEHVDDVSGKKRQQNLREGREAAEMSRTLVRLDPDVPLTIDWDLAQPGDADIDKLETLFREFDFRRLTGRVKDVFDALASGEGASPPGTTKPVGATTSGGPKLQSVETDAEPAPNEIQPTYHLIDTEEKFASFLEKLKQQTLISFDLETTNIRPRWAEIVGYAFAWHKDEAYYVAVRAPEGEPRIEPTVAIEALRPIIEDPDVRKVGQNLKYDMIVLRNIGVRLEGLAFDTMVGSYLLSAGRRNHNLDDLASEYLRHTTTKYSDLCGKGKDQKRIDEVPAQAVAEYAGEDAVLPLYLMPMLEERLRTEGLLELWETLERPLVDVLVELESNGIRLEAGRLEEMGVKHSLRLDQLETEIHELAGGEFNIASPKQLREILFEKLGLPVIKKTKTGPSTDVSVLEELALVHDLPAKIIEYRQAAKLMSTYIEALPEMILPETGRVHASFNQVVTATGRLSSSEPNLQNIPVRTEEGRAIRSAFVADPSSWNLLAADYSQIELRVLAHFTEDPDLCRAFEEDRDIHTEVAAAVFDVSPDEVTSDQRRKAKGVNFGVIYGQSAFGLAKQLRIDREEASAFIKAYFAKYPRIDIFLDRVLEDARRDGFVSTILGRKREITGLPDMRGKQSSMAERTAINTVIQGSAADLIKRAMVNIHQRMQRESCSARMLLQIHDELIFEVSPGEQEALARLVVEEMTSAFTLRVPLKVDLKAGPSWGETEGV